MLINLSDGSAIDAGAVQASNTALPAGLGALLRERWNCCSRVCTERFIHLQVSQESSGSGLQTKQRNTPRAVGAGEVRAIPAGGMSPFATEQGHSPALNHGEFTYRSIGTKSGVGLGWE